MCCVILTQRAATTGAGRKVGEGVSGGQGRTARFNARTHKHTYTHVQRRDSCKCKCDRLALLFCIFGGI